MDWTIIVDALVALLVAGSVGLIAYGGWICVRHVFGKDGVAEPTARRNRRSACRPTHRNTTAAPAIRASCSTRQIRTRWRHAPAP